MKILVIGSGGREHTIAWKLSKDTNAEIFTCPGNGGMQQIAQYCDIENTDLNGLLQFAKNKKIDLTVVGPEIPLSLGIVDIFKQNNLKIFGPVRKGALLESSKVFSKEFMKKHNIPTADFCTADTLSKGIKIIEQKQFPFVIKFDGLAAGKGVKIINSFEEGKNFLEDIFVRNIFKDSSPKALIEECLYGREISYLVFTDGKDFVPMVPAQDYKRVFDGDKGPNTGGMGSYSTPVFFNNELKEKIETQIVRKTLIGLEKEGIEYKGILYFGLMVSEEGIYLLEYNVRFGDPETQVILPRMETSLLEVMEAVIEGELKRVNVVWSDKQAVCVILASGGYPVKYEKGKEITGIEKVEDVTIFQAGTRKENGKLITSGGRVLGIVALDKEIEKAKRKVHRAAEIIQFEGKHYRKDIPILYCQE